MVRNAGFALLAASAVIFAHSGASAGSLNSYNSAQTPVVSYTGVPEPTTPGLFYDPAPAPMRDGMYDTSKGSNDDFGYSQSHACGGALDGATCLVILNDHMRRVRLERPAGTILVGNPAIADVTVLGMDTIFVSARSIGATNIIVLDDNHNEIRTFEVFVREPTTKRVVLRNAGAAENYQCAPNCLRALTQSDAAAPHASKVGVIQADIALDQTAIGLQAGVNPNQDPTALAGPAPAAPSAVPVAAPQAGAIPQSGMAQSLSGLSGAVGPAASAFGSMMGSSMNGPAITAPPPAIAN